MLNQFWKLFKSALRVQPSHGNLLRSPGRITWTTSILSIPLKLSILIIRAADKAMVIAVDIPTLEFSPNFSNHLGTFPPSSLAFQVFGSASDIISPFRDLVSKKPAFRLYTLEADPESNMLTLLSEFDDGIQQNRHSLTPLLSDRYIFEYVREKY